MRFPSSHRWSLCVTPKSPKGWLKTRISTFCIAFHIFVAGNCRYFKFGLQIDHSKSQPGSLRTTNCPWKGRGHVTWSTLNLKALNIPQICYTCRLYLMLPKAQYITPKMFMGMVTWLFLKLKFCLLRW